MNTATNYAELYLADISKNQEELENVARDYPVSSIARFLWLYQLKKNNDPRFNEVAKQTGIFLHNPYWMEFQLSGLSMVNENSLQENLVSSPETPGASGNNETAIESMDTAIENSEISIEDSAQPEFPIQTFEESNLLPVEENRTNEDLPQPVNEQILEISVLENQDSIDQNIENESKEEPIVSNENVVEEFVEKQNDEDSPQPVNEQISEISVLENQDSIDQNIEEEKKEQSIILNEKEEEEDHDEIPFEPLHAVDYFASQGIKLSEEALNNDQLGKQVKSFTAWLKSMKKLHPDQLPEQNEVIEKLIQTSSEVSNQNANVLTEAMAEVLIKQGKREKALEMYQKLSLINPSKSAYFAAKIESLKIT
ncbi:MAG: hypothetical protein ABI366_01215 [Ginsengibacter sp.]